MKKLAFIVMLVLTFAMSAAPLSAQTQRNQVPPAAGDLPSTFTYAEFQGMACLMGGAAAMVGVATYSELIAAATGGVSVPVIVPIIAAGFAAGCSVASTASPGLLWIYRHIHGYDPIVVGRGAAAASLPQ